MNACLILTEFTFDVLVCLTELANDSDHVVTPVNLIFCCCTAFVDNEVSVDQKFHLECTRQRTR